MREMGSTAMKKAREAAAGGRTQEVDRWLGEARTAGVSATELTAFQRDLSNAKQKAAAAESDRLAGLAARSYSRRQAGRSGER